MYFGLFDEVHKTALVDLEEKTPTKRAPTGIYDSGILCQDCDNRILGTLENYGKKILCTNDSFKNFHESNEIIESGGLKSAIVQVADYIKFKLFLISLLWKMHISKNSFFSQVDLGSIHSENLRKKILNHEKIMETEYEVAIIGIDKKIPDLITSIIGRPRKIKSNSNTYYVSIINGLFFMFNISPIDKLELITKSNLKENGRMLIPFLEGQIAKFFYDSINQVRVRRDISGKEKAGT
ncbi:MAG TPA: hypothetical protein DGG95_14615 [Cytophagales bacterium]|nr:hypothetical protein [Cytophagales bacterium]